MTRKFLLGVLAASVLAFAVARPAAAETTITIAGYGELFGKMYDEAVIAPFMAAHPDIKVEYYPSSSSAQILGTLRAQKASPEVDVAIMDMGVAKAGTDEGLFVPVDASVSPHVAELYPQARVAGIAGVGLTFDNLVLLYDKEKVSPAPTSWRAYWDPAMTRRISLSAPPEILGLSLTVIVEKMDGGADFKASTARAIADLGKLAPNVLTWDPKPDAYAPITSHQALLGLGWNARAQYYSALPGTNIAAVLPAEGSVLQINAINLVKGAKHEQAARAFVDYALSPVAQAAFSKAMFYAPTNSKAVLPAEISARTVAGSMDKVIEMNPLDLAAVRERMMMEWRRNVINR